MDGYAYALDESFSERMQRGRDEASGRVERLAYLGARVTYRRPASTVWYSVADVARLWSTPDQALSIRAVTKILDRGGIEGAVRSQTGRGRPWKIPATRQPDGSYRVKVLRGRRGAAHPQALSPGEVPF
jgi:hypothetical protein